jgi:hypothetical protein
MLRSKRFFAVAAALALALILGGASLAGATTGSTNGFPEPKVVVPVPVANPFTGRYVVQAVGRGASIRSGEMKIDFSESSATPQFLVGLVELYGYNPEGRIEINLLTLYPFQVVPGGVSAVVLGQAVETYKLGNMKLFTPTSDREVRGELTFAGQGTYPIVLRRLAQGETTGGNPPLAKQLGSEAESAGSGAAPAAPSSDPGANAGVLAPLVRAVQGLSG